MELIGTKKESAKMPPRRPIPQEPAPDIPTERAYELLSRQLEKLKSFSGLPYQQAEPIEGEWFQLSEKLMARSFGKDSSNYRNFSHAHSAGHYQRRAYGAVGVDHRLHQSNLVARCKAYETALNSTLAELRLDMPEDEIKGTYEPGEEYEFYRDVKFVVGLAHTELFIVDAYLSTEIFDVYAASISRSVRFRLLGANVRPEVIALGVKYASGGNFQFRSSNAIHDRVIFVDQRVWVCGQSLKDAAKKKPTYIVEHDESLMRPIYESVWSSAQPLL
jgi:hypothetical protein